MQNLSPEPAAAKKSSESATVPFAGLQALGKRLVPVAALALIATLVWQGDIWLAGRDQQRLEALAHTTAALWVGTAIYRADPASYSHYRDSVLRAHRTDSVAVRKAFDDYATDPERSLVLFGRINKLVDSMSRAREPQKDPHGAAHGNADSAADNSKPLEEY